MRLCLGGLDCLLSFVFRGRDSPRRATHFLLLRQKKVSKEKATPLSATPALRYGATCGARVSRGLAELASLKQLRALIRETLRSSAQPEGRANRTGLCFARPTSHRGAARLGGWDWLLVLVLGPSEAKAARSHPFCMRRGAQMEAGSGQQLFERSEFCGPPPESSTAGCPQRSGGTQTAGSPFLWLLSFGEAKESSSPAGARPGPRPQKNQKLTARA